MQNISRTTAVLLALLVTFLWSTSFIIIKFGLRDIPPITFAGLRYSIAFFALLPFALTGNRLKELKNINKNNWLKLLLLGLLFYTFTQGTQFIGLSLLPAVAVSLILNFTPLLVALSGIYFISEKPTARQWGGMALFIIGILFYFLPVDFGSSSFTGIIVMLLGVLFNSSSSILGRALNREKKFSPLIITVVSMGFGSVVLLSAGLLIHEFPVISFANIISLIWLAVVNTALAFTLWNLTLQKLTAMESSIINGTMLIQIAILGWIFLGESITAKEIAGMVIAAAGALLVQMKNSNNK